MQLTRRLLVGTALLFLAAGAAPAAVFQYSAAVKGEKGDVPAFMWIPADAKQVRGVIMVGTTVMEKEFSKDPVIRKACGEQQIAIILMKCGLGQTDLQKVLDDFAKVSGYREMAVAPLFFLGHSAGGPPAHDCAVKYGERCFGVVQYRGGGPYDGDAVPASVPSLAMLGQFDEYGGVMRREGGRDVWVNFCDRVAGYRSKDERRLASVVVEPGAGHFAWSERNAPYLAMFIAKAAKARIPASWRVDSAKPPTLLEIDPKSGWLTSLNLRSPGEGRPAAYEKYIGDKTTAAWHFDQEMAEATAKYNIGYDKRDQFIKWKDPVWVDAGTRHFFTDLKWVGDGQTLEVHPAYWDTYPANQPDGKGPKWLQAGQPVGHSKAPILVKQVVGPAVVAGPNTLRIEFDNISPASEGAKLNFMAYSVGDEEYRYTEQVGMTNRGFVALGGGKAQTITFPPVGNLKANAGPVELKATSDSGLKVEYYVGAGPGDDCGGEVADQRVAGASDVSDRGEGGGVSIWQRGGAAG